MGMARTAKPGTSEWMTPGHPVWFRDRISAASWYGSGTAIIDRLYTPIPPYAQILTWLGGIQLAGGECKIRCLWKEKTLRRWIISHLIFVLSLCAAAPSAAQDLPVYRLPLNVMAMTPNDTGQKVTPGITVGRLPADRTLQPWGFYAQPHPEEMLSSDAQTTVTRGASPAVASDLDDLLSGAISLQAPTEGSPVVALLKGPDLNSGESWDPAELTLQGFVLTLKLDHWTSDADRRRNALTHPAYLLSLGSLPAGEYLLQVTVRTLLEQTSGHGRTTPASRVSATSTGKLPFTVHPKTESVEGVAASSLGLGALVEEKVPNDGAGSVYQRPMSVMRRAPVISLVMGQSSVGGHVHGVFAGTLDLARFIDQTGSGWMKDGDWPILGKPRARDSVVAGLVGPTCQTGEWISLASVEWKGRNVILHLDSWTDTFARDKSYLFIPILFIPLTPPADAARDTGVEVGSIEVSWTHLVSDTPGGHYLLSLFATE